MIKFVFLFLFVSNFAYASCFELEQKIHQEINVVVGQAWKKNPDNYVFHNSVRNAIDNYAYVLLNRMHEKARLNLECVLEYQTIKNYLQNIQKNF